MMKKRLMLILSLAIFSTTSHNIVAGEYTVAQVGPPDEYHHQRARNMAQRERFMAPAEIKIMGEKTSNPIVLPILPPPREMTACNGSVKIGNGVPVPNEPVKRKSGWWLLATTSSLGVTPLKNPNTVYFYWARQISADEVGLTYSGFASTELDPKNMPDQRIFIGNSMIPYQWVTYIHNFGMFPHMPGEPCPEL